MSAQIDRACEHLLVAAQAILKAQHITRAIVAHGRSSQTSALGVCADLTYALALRELAFCARALGAGEVEETLSALCFEALGTVHQGGAVLDVN